MTSARQGERGQPRNHRSMTRDATVEELREIGKGVANLKLVRGLPTRTPRPSLSGLACDAERVGGQREARSE
jgi:hypothetical protein